MKKTIIIAILIITASIAHTQTASDKVINHFFETFEKDGISSGIDYLFTTNKWIHHKQDAIVKLKTQAESYLTKDVLGKYYGYEIITHKTVGNSFEYVSYMIKYERQPIRFNFVMYKPSKDWVVQNFSFDDNLDDELEEAGKVYRLPENR